MVALAAMTMPTVGDIEQNAMSEQEPQPAAPKPRIRWFHVTPGRVLAALLAVEGLLWLSERFRWFAFNHHKGWTVLIAVACLGAGLLAMLLWFLVALLFRLRFQFRLRSLSLLAVAVALPFSWLTAEMKQARQQKAVREEIKKMVGLAQCDSQVARREPEWLRSLLGEDFFSEVEKVLLFQPRKVTSDFVEGIGGMTALNTLTLGRTDITDAGLKKLAGLTASKRFGWTTTPA